MILNIYYNDFQHMGMSQMFTGAGDYFSALKTALRDAVICNTYAPKW